MADGVRYTRLLHPHEYRADPGCYNTWQAAFQTSDLARAYAAVAEAGGTLELMNPDDVPGEVAGGARGVLRHTLWAPVFHTHPTLGRELYFSAILSRHGSWLDGHPWYDAHVPDAARRTYHCVWADGEELSAAELAELRGVHEECTVRLPLAAGDVLVLDNLRVAHGRTPYGGATPRRMGLMLSELVGREAHRTPPAAWEAWRAAAMRHGPEVLMAHENNEEDEPRAAAA